MPTPPDRAEGRNGRWVPFGTVGVDSATLCVTDPYVGNHDDGAHMSPDVQFAPWGIMGVRFWCGFGDGSYEVWGWVADYSDDPEHVDERVAEVRISMITPQILAEDKLNDERMNGS